MPGTHKSGDPNVGIRLKGKGGRPKGSKQRLTNKTLQNWEYAARQAGAKDFDKIKNRARGEKRLFLEWMNKNQIDFIRELVKRRVAKPAEIQQDIKMTVKWSDSDTKYGSGPI